MITEHDHGYFYGSPGKGALIQWWESFTGLTGGAVRWTAKPRHNRSESPSFLGLADITNTFLLTCNDPHILDRVLISFQVHAAARVPHSAQFFLRLRPGLQDQNGWLRAKLGDIRNVSPRRFPTFVQTGTMVFPEKSFPDRNAATGMGIVSHQLG